MSRSYQGAAQAVATPFYTGMACGRRPGPSVEDRLAQRELRAKGRVFEKRVETHRQRRRRVSLLNKLKRISYVSFAALVVVSLAFAVERGLAAIFHFS